MDLYYKVAVTGFDTTATEDNVFFGLTVSGGKGSFAWTAASELLLETWSNGISKNIDLRRGGKFSSTSGGEIYLDTNSGLLRFVKRNGIKLEGAKITIYYGKENELPELLVGVVTGLEQDISRLTLKFDDPSAYRNAVISILAEDGETYYPALFGEHEKAKAVKAVKRTETVMDTPLEYVFMPQLIGTMGTGSRLHFWIHDPVLLSKINEIRLAIDNGADDYYAYCVNGNGEGEARKIRHIYDAVLNGLINVELSEQYYTTINEDEGRIGHVFRAAYEATGSVTESWQTESLKYDEYEQISVFVIAKVNVKYAVDSGLIALSEADAAKELTFYTHSDGVYIPCAPKMFSVQPINGKADIALIADTFKDRFASIDMLVPLKGKNFQWDRDYFGNELQDVAVFHDPLGREGDKWRWRWWSSSEQWFGAVPHPGLAHLFMFLSGELPDNPAEKDKILKLHVNSNAIEDIFDNTHNVKVVMLLERGDSFPDYTVSITMGVPFTFEFERIPGISEIMLNYDIDILMQNHYSATMLLPDSKHLYELITALVGVPSKANILLPRHYRMDDIYLESQHAARSGVSYLITNHRINTCYNLDWYARQGDSNIINNYDALQGTLLRNGNFWRQDVFAVDEILAQQDSSDKTNYVSGYEAIREGGGGFFSIPAKVGDNDTLKFRAMLAISGGIAGGNVTNGPVHHRLSFRAIQCLAKIGFNVDDGVFLPAKGRLDRITLPGFAPETHWNGWARIYESVLKWQNYQTSFINGFTRPDKGWGTAYPSPEVSLYSEVIANLPYFYSSINFPVRRQLFTKPELETKSVKDELLRTAWHGGFIDRQGKESVFDIISEPASRAVIAYTDIFPGTLSSISAARKEDIFCEPSLSYNYDIGSDSYLSQIGVVNIDTSSPEIIGEDRLDDSQKMYLLKGCRRLFDRYGLVNDAPSSLTESKWIYTDGDAYRYILNWLAWQGICEGNGENDFERREIGFTLPVGIALAREIDLGRGIEIEIPRLSAPVSGMITSVSWTFDRGHEEVRCKALIKIFGEGV